jgi:two-component system cell cycle sensor histidine kinase/response regulator CckA
LTEVFQTVNTVTGTSVEVPLPEKLQDVFAPPENIYLISKSHDQVFIDASVAPVQIDSGRALGEVLAFRDATRCRQNEAALLESERQRLQALRMESIGRLAGGMAHEFNNLLTIINGHAALVLKQIDYSSQWRDGIEDIRRAGERAASLTRQLLVFSRGQPVKLEVVDRIRLSPTSKRCCDSYCAKILSW